MKSLSEDERLFSRSSSYLSFVRRRSRISSSIILCSIGLVLVFIVVSIFLPSAANLAIDEQGSATVGIALAILIIILMVLAAVYFVYWNNREHTRLSRIIHNEYLKNLND